VTPLGAGGACRDPLQVDGRDELLVDSSFDLWGESQRLDLGLNGREEEGQRRQQLRGQSFGLGDARAGARGQVDLLGQFGELDGEFAADTDFTVGCGSS